MGFFDFLRGKWYACFMIQHDSESVTSMRESKVYPTNIQVGDALRLSIKDDTINSVYHIKWDFLVTIIESSRINDWEMQITISQRTNGWGNWKIYTLISTLNDGNTWKYKWEKKTIYLELTRVASSIASLWWQSTMPLWTTRAVSDVIDKPRIISARLQNWSTLDIELRGDIGIITLAWEMFNNQGLSCRFTLNGMSYDRTVKFFPQTWTCSISYTSNDGKKVKMNANYKNTSSGINHS